MGKEVIIKIPVPANTGLTSASAGKLFKPSGYLLSLAPVYYNMRNQLVKEYIDGRKHKKGDPWLRGHLSYLHTPYFISTYIMSYPIAYT